MARASHRSPWNLLSPGRSAAVQGQSACSWPFRSARAPIDLSVVRRPIFMLAARDDEIVAPDQLLAARHLVGSKERQICTDIVACTHLGLFLGATTLLHTW